MEALVERRRQTQASHWFQSQACHEFVITFWAVCGSIAYLMILSKIIFFDIAFKEAVVSSQFVCMIIINIVGKQIFPI